MSEVKKHRIEVRDGEWCVVSEDGIRDLGCFPSEDQARERLRQVEAAKAAKGMSEALEQAHRDGEFKEYGKALSGVEIFRTGTWNGDKYNARDLDDMVSAFEKQGFRPPVKLGHKENSGDPAFGWVQSIRREGERLIADFIDLPDKVFDMIKDRRFDAVSSEIFWNLKRGGETFRRALKAVALLGAEIPAVAGLKPLRESVEINTTDGEAHVYTITLKEFTMADQKTAAEKTEKAGEPDEKVEALNADLQKAQDQIKELTAKLEAQKGQKEQADTSALQIKALQEKVESLTEAAETAAERERRTTIDAKVEKLRIPALRTHVAAIYDLATSTEPEKTVKFSVQNGDKTEEKDTDPVAVVDDLVVRLNKHTEKLFSEFATTGDLRRDDHPVSEDPGAEIDRLAKAYAAEKKVDYQTAFNAVLADPEHRELAAAYAR